MCIEINKLKSKPFALILCYQPPDLDAKSFLENLQSVFNIADSRNEEVFILSDLNCNMLSSNDCTPTRGVNSICKLYQLNK